jgi:polyhydroxyalkanoate synthesis regulator phasin
MGSGGTTVTSTETRKPASVTRLTAENQRLRTELQEVRRTSRDRIRELETRLRTFHVADFEAAKTRVLALEKELAELRRKVREL